MSDLARGLKALTISIAIYAVIALIYNGAGLLDISLPNPPAPPSNGNVLTWVGFVFGLVAYPFQMLFTLLGFMGAVMSFNIIPSPWNWVFAIPVGLLFFYGLFIVLMEILDRIKFAVPLPV